MIRTYTRGSMLKTAGWFRTVLKRDIRFAGFRLWPFKWIAVGVLWCPRLEEK